VIDILLRIGSIADGRFHLWEAIVAAAKALTPWQDEPRLPHRRLDFLVLPEGKAHLGEGFDTDLMFWLNGWTTLFSAVHVCLGDLYRDGIETILARHRKDPLTKALGCFDLRLLRFYTEVRDDLEQRIAAATSRHHLFHAITEDAGMRLHMTR